MRAGLPGAQDPGPRLTMVHAAGREKNEGPVLSPNELFTLSAHGSQAPQGRKTYTGEIAQNTYKDSVAVTTISMATTHISSRQNFFFKHVVSIIMLFF